MILLRHGQSDFNLHFGRNRRDPGIIDPKLTPLGHAQVTNATQKLAQERISRVISSPYTRALQTADPIAKRLKLPLIINPVVRERYAFVCDIGSPRAKLELDWPEYDFSAVEEVWWPAVEEPAEAIIARAALFRTEMAALPDWSDTLVVSHWGFILCMTGRSIGNGTWLRCDPRDPPPAEVVWRA